MPRIRTLKPEHRQHRKVGPLSHRQYRLWVGMICEADDQGRLVASAASLRVTIFGYHPDVTDAIVDAELAVLSRLGLVRLYFAQNQRYALFPDWADHQRIDKPKPSKLPAPRVRDASKKGRGLVPDASQMNPGGSEGIGRDQGSDRKGGEGTGGEPPPDRLLTPPGSDRTNGPEGVGEVIARMNTKVLDLRTAEGKPGGAA